MSLFLFLTFFVFYDILLYFLRLEIYWGVVTTFIMSISQQRSLSQMWERGMWSLQLTSKHFLQCCTFCHTLYECWCNVCSSSTFKHLNSQLWTTVKICLQQISLSIFKLSVMRRDLSHHWQISLWWSTSSERDEKTE